MNNSIMKLDLFKEKNTWMFNDESFNIIREPFVLGMSEMIDHYVNNPTLNKTTIFFSHDKFPHCHELKLLNEDSDGGWYQDVDTKMVGWLCPVTRVYMKNIPEKIYFMVENN